MDSTFKTYLKPHQFSSIVAMLVQTVIIVYLDNGKSLLSSFSGLFFSSTPFLHSIEHLGTIFWESNKYPSLHSATQNLLMTPPVIVKSPSIQWPTGPSGPSYFSSFFLLLLSSHYACILAVSPTFWAHSGLRSLPWLLDLSGMFLHQITERIISLLVSSLCSNVASHL